MARAALIRRAGAVAVTAGLAVAGLTAPGASAAGPQPLPLGQAELPISAGGDATGLVAPQGAQRGKRQAYLLRLEVRSTATVFAAAGKGATGRRAAREQLGRVQAVQDRVIARLPARTPVLYTTHALLSGVAVTTRSANRADLEAIPGVAKVYPIAPKSQTLSSSIPLQGGPSAWEMSGTGAGTKIAIIDTGVDYTHADFGGEGTRRAFELAQAIDDKSWVTPKVVDGFDFVGDDYNADMGTSPVPDPNPLDCGGHGTHVAGIAAGQGVTKGRDTYTGVYNESIDYTGLEIGPGMAPEASLYAYKVFGCEGSTNVVTAAIDRAVDPDGDGSPSDRVDVINMSLGSDFGSADDADSIASNAAVDAGVVVVASAGNGGDLTDVAGSPANATKAISVANSVDAQSILDGADVLIDGAAQSFGVTRAIRYDWTSGDLAGPVVDAPATNQDACQAFTPSEAATIKDKVVLVKWTQEALECGSITRGGNLRAAGAIGFIFANSAETFNAGINGDNVIPGVLMVKSGADAIRAALAGSKPVEVTGTQTNTIVQDFPGNVDKVSDSSSRGIHEEGNLKPDIAAVGETVFSAAVGTGTEGISETGTSMAGPTVAGLAALVKQTNPTWTPMQIKAAIMNSASDLFSQGNGLGDRFAPVRVGAGRINAVPAVTSEVTAAVVGDPGAVSVGFGPVEVDGPNTVSKTVEVTNNGSGPVEYRAHYDAITEVEGIWFTVNPSGVTVPAGGTAEVMVTMHALSRGALDNTVDPTVGRIGIAGLPRTTLAEASGHLLFTPASGNELRVPVYAAPRPVSELSGGAQLVLDPVTDEGVVTMSGPGLGFGENGTSDADPANDITSMGGAFELATTDEPAPECGSPGEDYCWNLPIERAGDIRRVGVTTNNDMAYFAVTADRPWNTPAGLIEYDVYLDLDGDSTPEFVAYTTRYPDSDTFLSGLYDFNTGEGYYSDFLNGLPGDIDTALYDSDTMLIPVSLETLRAAGFDPSDPRVNYGLETWSLASGALIDDAGFDPVSGDMTLSVDLVTPGLAAVDGSGNAIYPETDATTLAVTRNAAVYEANKSEGLMLVHFHNKVGSKSEVLDVVKAAAATQTVLTPSATSVEVGKPVELAVSVSSAVGTPAGKVQVVASQTGAVLAEGDLTAGAVTLGYTPTTVGAVPMVARYLGGADHQPSTSVESVLSVTEGATTETTPTPTPTATPTPTPTIQPGTPKQKQRLEASLPRSIKRSGLTLITAANTRTNAGQLVRTLVNGQSTAAGQAPLYKVVRGKNGKVSVRTFGHRGLRLKVIQRAPATSDYRPFQRRAVYLDGVRKK